ncbi:MAG: nuclear transport factor 2 family protein [Pleurocapsa sp. MO_192.B19]|nr:nuclear transport factor 2 family protein [Pleurocapsa sp. MO_192.B19]
MFIYAFVVRKVVERVFESLNRGDYETVLKDISPSITHEFSGSHALGGTRHSIEAMRQWFQRLYRLVPEMHFTIEAVTVNGFPWNMTIAVEWTETAIPVDGSHYTNAGVNVIKMQWGKVVNLRIYEDTQRVKAMLGRLAAQGIAEAKALPIVD